MNALLVALLAPLPRVADAPDLEPAPGIVRVELTAAPRPDGTAGFVYAYNGQIPGPTLRAQRGDLLVVELTNALDAPTTIHWHGVHVPWAMDGVTWMAEPVQPGETFTYQFALEQAGTYWYHPHFDTERQVDGGLYGALVVTDPAEPVADDDLLLVFDLPEEVMGEGDRHAHGHGHLFPTWLINGAPAPHDWTLPAGSHTRVRAVNVSGAGYLALRYSGLRQIASDQGLLAAENRRSPVVLGPGDRADFELLAGDEPIELRTLPYSLNGGRAHGDAIPLVSFALDGATDRPEPLAWPYSGAAPSPDPGHTDLLYVFTGSDRTGQWFINGEQFPDITIESLPLGADVVVELRNVSPTHHPWHLHGHAFEVLSINGERPEHQRIEDTLDVPIHGTARLRLVADNPGDWMAHCHILPHAEEGMMTVLRVGE